MRKRKRPGRIRRSVIAAAAIICTAVFTVVILKNTLKKPAVRASAVTSEVSSEALFSSPRPEGSEGNTASSKGRPQESAPVGSSAKPASDIFKGAVFMGDSITEDMLNYDVADNANIVSSIGASAYKALNDHSVAINGNSKDLAWMPERVAKQHPQKIYMMFGSNDLSWGSDMTENAFAGYYGGLIDALRNQCPNAEIFVESILPMTKSAENTKDFPFDNDKIGRFNAALQKMCDKRSIKYLDIASVMKGADGALPAGDSDDGVHLRSKGYKKWFSYIEQNS